MVVFVKADFDLFGVKSKLPKPLPIRNIDIVDCVTSPLKLGVIEFENPKSLNGSSDVINLFLSPSLTGSVCECECTLGQRIEFHIGITHTELVQVIVENALADADCSNLHCHKFRCFNCP